MMTKAFESIYDNHGTLFNLIKCVNCGTHIFSYYDERDDPNLQCPVCTGYKTRFAYLTAAEIEADEDKRKLIEFYKESARLDREADERYIKRGGLYDFERTQRKRVFDSKKYYVDVQVRSFHERDLQLSVWVWKKTDYGAVGKHHISIPLNLPTLWSFIKYRIKPKVTWSDI